MKQYRLKQWYPSLPPGLKPGMIVEFDGINSIMWEVRDKHQFTDYSCGFNGLELECTQYWELIEEQEPLFITEDGVEIFLGQVYFSIDIEFNKRGFFALDSELAEGVKIFKHESNADKYILWNKPLLSLNEIDDTIEVHTHEFEELIKLAKGRIEQ